MMLEEVLRKNQLAIGIFLLGVVLLGLGVLVFKANEITQEPEIEILGSQTEEEGEATIIIVEVAGEIIKPGVYELENESRINDLLTLAGGLSQKADRDWVAQNINLAQKLVDGAKIYIPEKNEIPSSKLQSPNNNQITNSKIKINTASQSELESLWGIGPVTAKKIIEERPFVRTDELLEKKIVKSNVWERIKDQITVY